jgi:tetratricopeptide (TPR) repeat protein
MPERTEIAKRVAQAEKLLQKGKTGDALDEYLQILLEDPDNDNVRSMAADLCLSLNRTNEAVSLLGDLFERQVGMGDATRASLTYKKLARHGNPTWQQKFRFGQLLENSNKKLAVGTYENALDDLFKQRKKGEALQILTRVVTLEPTQANFLRFGELSSELGDRQAAAAAFLRVAELAEAGGQDAGQYFERAYSEDPSDMRIGLAYGRNLLAQGQVGAAIFIFEPHVMSGNAPMEMRDSYAQALLAANRLTEAEPFVWQLFEQNAGRLPQVVALIGALVDAQQDAEAVALARNLEQFQRKRGERRAFVAMMQDLTTQHRASPEMLEFLSELFNSSNRETDYSQTLLKLFDLYVSTGNFVKAAECLDRAADVDPYERGHQRRLESLQGKIDDGKYNVIASRLSQMNKSVPTPTREEPTLGAAALQDLMLQAEILVQYGMRSKAVERLQRI